MSKTTLPEGGGATAAEPAAVNGMVHVSPKLSVHSTVAPPAETAGNQQPEKTAKVEIVRTFDDLTWDGGSTERTSSVDMLRKPYRNHPIRYGGLCEKMHTDSVKLAVKGSHQAGSNHGYTRKEDGSYYGS